MYCAEEDLYFQIYKENIISFAKEADDTGDEYKNRITEIIKKASGEIDGYLAKQYNLPLSNIPESIKDICVVITIYKTICRKGIDKNMPESIWLDRYKSAISFLEDVRDGKNDIGVVSQTGESKPSSFYDSITEHKTFDREFWKGY